MEYFGYKVFADSYEELTPDQVLFLDMGLIDIHKQFNGADEKNTNKLNQLNNGRIRSRSRL